MFKVNADRMVVDLLTGSLASQGDMLKTLMTRSGYGRNQWHKLAQQKVARLNSSPTSLSDIFAGRRGLPQRDIIPLISVLKLSESDREHYICEFLKGTIDESLNSFIAPTRRTKRYDVMKERIQELQSMIKDLERCNFYERHVEHFEALENLKKKNAPQVNATIKSQTHKFDEDQFIESQEKLQHENSLYDFIERAQARSAKFYQLECKKWMLGLRELNSHRQNKLLLKYVSICLPNNFREQLINSLADDSTSIMTENPLETWGWVTKRVNIRPQKYIHYSLFISWMNEYPEDFEVLHDFYATQYEGITMKIDKPPKVPHSFSQYLSVIYHMLSKENPKLHALLKPSTRTIFINHAQTEKEVFNDYLSKKSKSASFDFNEHIESIYPSALSTNDILYNLKLSIVPYMNTQPKSNEGKVLATVFKKYGNAIEYFSSVDQYLEANTTSSLSVNQMLDICHQLSNKLISEGLSKPWKFEMDRIQSELKKIADKARDIPFNSADEIMDEDSTKLF
jgi:hypothetical protein